MVQPKMLNLREFLVFKHNLCFSKIYIFFILYFFKRYPKWMTPMRFGAGLRSLQKNTKRKIQDHPRQNDALIEWSSIAKDAVCLGWGRVME